MKYKTYFRAAIFAIIGLILLISVFLINYLCPGSTNILVLIYINTASAVASIMLISGVWEAKSKRSFAEEVLELSEVSDSYRKSGITSVYKDFNDINWEDFFESAKKCFFALCVSFLCCHYFTTSFFHLQDAILYKVNNFHL